MPRYDYRCNECGLVFEVSHGRRERPDVTCPECGKPATRQLNMSGIVLKGSGFYNTDMRGKSGGTEGTGTAKPTSEPSAPSTPEAPAPAAPASSSPAPSSAE